MTTTVQRGFVCYRPTGEVLHVEIKTWDAPCGGGWVSRSETEYPTHLKNVEELLHCQRSNASFSLRGQLCIEYLYEYGMVHVHKPQ